MRGVALFALMLAACAARNVELSPPICNPAADIPEMNRTGIPLQRPLRPDLPHRCERPPPAVEIIDGGVRR